MSDEEAQRGLLLLRAGARVLAVHEDEADGVVEWREPVPLPHAPPAVLGVVSIRGRMRTVLDPAVMLGETKTNDEAAPRLLVVLRGDEQLALAVSHAERVNALHEDETVHLLDPAHLFAAATQGTERRRKRSDE
jgi:chemotaxis signal transduction protein